MRFIWVSQPLQTSRIWLKWSFIGLNSKFFFTETGYHTKVKEFSLSYYLPIVGKSIVGCKTFPGLLALSEVQTCPGFELWSRVFSQTITISARSSRWVLNTLLIRHPPKNGVLSMTVFNQWWGPCSLTLQRHIIIAMTPDSSLTWSSNLVCLTYLTACVIFF